MGDHMYKHWRSICSSTSISSPPDDLSAFMQQILLRSSSSSVPLTSMAGLCNAGTTGENLNPSQEATLFQDGILAVDSTTGGSAFGGVCFSSSATHNVIGAPAANVSSSSVGVSENETDDYDCESEENVEAWVEEFPVKPLPPQSSSKRTRAAEVHNLSEKRRRSRINEKMKALQNLIPNSNKTDKASMLDEAIEYLKQLQVQVQMLSMRNGMTLHPMCLPGALQHIPLSQMRMEYGTEDRPLPLNWTSIFPLQQDNLIHEVQGLINQCTTSNPPPVPSMTCILNGNTSSELHSCIQSQSHLRPFHLHRTSEGISREDMLHHQHLNAIHQQTNSLGVAGCSASISLSLNAQNSELKHKTQFRDVQHR